MAEFDPAFDVMIKNEGGFQLHTVAGDRGGMTYAGIARNFHSDWPGWPVIDRVGTDDEGLTQLVRDFYKEKFWDRLKGDEITSQEIAETVFDFAVNAGVRTAAKLAQLVVDSAPDGVIGPNSVRALNAAEPEMFVAKYALAKVARYAEICRRDPSQRKFLLGWINRVLRGTA